MLNDNINSYLQKLKNKEHNIKKKIEMIEHRKRQMKDILNKIETIEYSSIPLYKIGVWDDNLTKKIVAYETCVYETEEKIVDAKGDYEYLTDVPRDVLLKVLRDSREKYLKEISHIEQEIAEEIKML